MLYAVIDGLRRLEPATEFSVLTTFPEPDRIELESAADLGTFDPSNIELFDLGPLKLLTGFALGVFVRLALMLRLPVGRMIRNGALRAILDADAVVDIVDRSMLSQEAKAAYLALYEDRSRAIRT